MIKKKYAYKLYLFILILLIITCYILASTLKDITTKLSFLYLFYSLIIIDGIVNTIIIAKKHKYFFAFLRFAFIAAYSIFTILQIPLISEIQKINARQNEIKETVTDYYRNEEYFLLLSSGSHLNLKIYLYNFIQCTAFFAGFSVGVCNVKVKKTEEPIIDS